MSTSNCQINSIIFVFYDFSSRNRTFKILDSWSIIINSCLCLCCFHPLSYIIMTGDINQSFDLKRRINQT